MHVISQSPIRDAKEKFKDAANALDGWYRVLKSNDFENFSELKQAFNSVDKVGKYCVFNVGGNKLRIITVIHFDRGKVYIRGVLTHKEYDSWTPD